MIVWLVVEENVRVPDPDVHVIPVPRVRFPEMLGVATPFPQFPVKPEKSRSLKVGVLEKFTVSDPAVTLQI